MWANDTPNFIGNRIGLQSMGTAIHLMGERGLAPEDVDAITGVAMAHPKSATFRTADVVGLDTVGHVADNCYRSLVDDEDRATFALPAYIKTMIERGQLGDKTNGGFYKKQGDGLLTLDPKTGEYRAKAGDPRHRQGDQGDRARSRIPRSGSSAGRGARQDGEVRVDGDVAQPGVRGAPDPRDRGLDRGDRRRDEVGLRVGLGPFETWDALGSPRPARG